jgi:hypothetical protein
MERISLAGRVNYGDCQPVTTTHCLPDPAPIDSAPRSADLCVDLFVLTARRDSQRMTSLSNRAQP